MLQPPDNSGEAIQMTVVDGVPVFWVPEAIRLVGALMFRVGRADEPLVRGGLTHLVEHLALYGLGGKRTFGFNGSVDGLHVTFVATGTPDELVTYFNHVCAALRALPLERAENEARVLRTEAGGRTASVVEHLLWLRYGAKSHGNLIYREFALERPNKAAISAWAADHFTAGNAAAWFSGPIPAGLRLDIPDGPRRPTIEPHPIPGLKLPAWSQGRVGGVAISLVGARERWSFVPLRLASLRVQQRLRYEKGLTYQVDVAYTILSRDTSQSVMVATALEEHGQTVADDILDVLYTMSREGPTESELAEAVADFERSQGGPEAIPGKLDNRAFSEIVGSPFKTTSQLAEELRAMTPASVAEVLAEAGRSAILIIPPGVECTNYDFQAYPGVSSLVVVGKRYRSSAAPFPWSKNQPELIVGADGVSIVSARGLPVTVLYADLVAAFERVDGALELVGTDGFGVTVHAPEWRDGTDARDRVFSAISHELLVQHADT